MVRTPGPPRTETTAKLAKQNANTSDAAPRTAPLIAGQVTSANTRRGVAPSDAADSSWARSSMAHVGPTTRSTTATLNAVCAHRIAGIPREGRRAATPVAITTAGMRNGTVASAASNRAPRNVHRDTAQVSGSPTACDSTVLATACHSVNQATPRSEASVTTSATAPVRRCPASMDTTGQAKNTARKTSGAALAARTGTVAVLTARWLSIRPATCHGSPR